MPRPRLHLIRFHGVLVPSAKLRALMMSQVPELAAQAPPPADSETRCAQNPPVRLRWARLLARVFALDLGHCPNCDGELKIIAAILE